MATVSSVVPQVAVHVPEASHPVISIALINAARDLCQKARVLRKTLDPIDSVADQGVYSPSYPAGYELVDFINVRFEDRGLSPTTTTKLGERDPKWRDKSGNVDWYLRDGANGIRLVKKPSSAVTDAINIEAAVKPALGGDDIDDLLVSEHLGALVDGTLYYLYRMPNKPWSSMNSAGSHNELFQYAIDQAWNRASDGHIKGVRRRVKYGGL